MSEVKGLLRSSEVRLTDIATPSSKHISKLLLSEGEAKVTSASHKIKWSWLGTAEYREREGRH